MIDFQVFSLGGYRIHIPNQMPTIINHAHTELTVLASKDLHFDVYFVYDEDQGALNAVSSGIFKTVMRGQDIYLQSLLKDEWEFAGIGNLTGEIGEIFK